MVTNELIKANYPDDRKAIGHAIRFIKALVISNAATSRGRGAVQLAVIVAATEDRLHYSKPPAFWRSQLLKSLGMTNPSQLVEARQEAIEAGLLHYQRGRKARPGIYWTLVPEWLQPHYAKPTGGKYGSESGSENGKYGSENGSENVTFGSESGSENGKYGSESGSHSNPLRSLTPSLPLRTRGGMEEFLADEEEQPSAKEIRS